MRPGKNDLRPLGNPFHIVNICADPFTAFEHFLVNLLRLRDDSFRPSQVDDDIAPVKPLYKTVDQFALFILVFVINIVPFSVFDLLDNNLFRRLRSDPAERCLFQS